MWPWPQRLPTALRFGGWKRMGRSLRRSLSTSPSVLQYRSARSPPITSGLSSWSLCPLRSCPPIWGRGASKNPGPNHGPKESINSAPVALDGINVQRTKMPDARLPTQKSWGRGSHGPSRRSLTARGSEILPAVKGTKRRN